MNCPHCDHPWDQHNKRCAECGCMWSEPKPPAPPPTPPSARDQLIANIENTIWAELERQAQDSFGPYVDRAMDMVDASGAGVDMGAVAEAVAELFIDSEDDCSSCRSHCAIDVWKEPLTDEDEQ